MEKGSFPGSDGRSLLRCYSYLPQGEPRAVLQVIHGMAEHFARYEDFASHMAARGIAVLGHDQLGHGESSEPADYGYFAGSGGWELLVKDVQALRLLGQERWPGLPYFMLGHSMGSLILRNYLAWQGEGLAGAVLTGTSGPKALNQLGIALVRFLRLFRGDRHRSSFVHTMAFGGNNRRIGSPANLYAWLTSDEKESGRYVQDPMCGFTFTLAGFQDLFTLLARASRPDLLQTLPRRLPLLLASGLEDPVGDYGKGVSRVADRFKEAGMEEVDLLLYEGMRHEILNEQGRQTVYVDIGDFIQRQAEAFHGSPGQ